MCLHPHLHALFAAAQCFLEPLPIMDWRWQELCRPCTHEQGKHPSTLLCLSAKEASGHAPDGHCFPRESENKAWTAGRPTPPNPHESGSRWNHPVLLVEQGLGELGLPCLSAHALAWLLAALALLLSVHGKLRQRQTQRRT